jgi:hypothetical protein
MCFFKFLKYLFKVSFSLMIIQAFALGQGEAYRSERIYQLKCSRCHFAYSPENYAAEEWATIMETMGPLAGLDEEQEKVILDYLQGEASKKEKGVLPTSPVLSGYVYTEFFSSQDSTDTFDLHYLNINISGRLHDRISYRTEFEFEHGGAKDEPPFIEQAYIDIRLQRYVGLRIGAMLTPFNRFDEFHGPLENLMVTRPQVSREIGVSAWKEVGVDLHGHLPLHRDFYLNCDAYIINGLGSGSRLRGSRQYRDNNDAKSFGLRLSGVFADNWEAGASWYRGAWDDSGNFPLTLYGFHLLGRFQGFNLFAEYAHSLSENPEPIAPGKGKGFFLQISYLIDYKWRPTIRYEALDYLDPGDLLGRKPADFDKSILALGLNFYPTPMIVFKLEYDFVREGKRMPEKDNNLLALQAAVRF